MASPYYELHPDDTGPVSQTATGVTHEQAFIHRLSTPGPIEDPPELVWQWRSATHPPDDIVFTIDVIRLVSPRVREVFEAHLTDADEIQWLPATLLDHTGQRLPHWVPHFPTHHDVIDRDRSTFGPSGLAMRYVLSLAALTPHAVTVIPDHYTGYLISADVADALRTAGITGARITPAPVA